jgi:hypothetical protein
MPRQNHKANHTRGGRKQSKNVSIANSTNNLIGGQEKVSHFSIKDSTTHRVTMRAVYTVGTSASGIISSQAYDDATIGTDWSNWQVLFDSYKPTELIYQWFPAQTFDGAYPYRPLYFVFDTDATSTITQTVAAFILYENLKVMNIQSPFSLMVRIPAIVSAKGTTHHILPEGWRDTTDPFTSCSIQAYGTGYSNSITYGVAVISVQVMFRNKI